MNHLQQRFEKWASGSKHTPDPELLAQLRGSTVLIKYGGNAMNAESGEDPVLDQVALLSGAGIRPVIVHGGGPVIRRTLEEAGVSSEFIDGHRKTDEEAMRYVEMALRGQVNGLVVKRLNSRGVRAVGLSGKDASMVRVERRFHRQSAGGKTEKVDLGYVGDVSSVDTSLICMLLDHHYLPVIAPVATGADGMDYNINADMFAGHVAGALAASAFVAVTDVDGLMSDPSDPETRLELAGAAEIRAGIGKTILGGMIPKVEACLIALDQGVKKAHIVNGRKPDSILNELLTSYRYGTTIEQ